MAILEENNPRVERLKKLGIPDDMIQKARQDEAVFSRVEQVADRMEKAQPTAPKTPAFSKPAAAAVPTEGLDIETAFQAMPALPDAVKQKIRDNPNVLPAVQMQYEKGVKAGVFELPKNQQLADSKAQATIGIKPETVAATAEQDFNFGTYVLQQLGEGASFGIYSSELTGPDLPTKAVGLVANIVGGLVTGAAMTIGLGEIGFLGGLGTKVATAATEAKNVKTLFQTAKAVAKGAEGTELAVEAAGQAAKYGKQLFRANAKKIGLETAKVAAEGAAIGAGVGATKEVIRGGSTADVMTGAISEGINFAAFGAVLTPIAAGMGSLATRKQFGKAAKAVEEFASTEANQAFLKRASETNLQELVSLRKANPAEFDAFISKSSDPALLKRTTQSFEAMEKIAKTNPYMSQIELLANPEVLNNVKKAETADAIRNVFLDPESPLSSLYQSNPDLQAIVDRGHFGVALDLVKKEIHGTVKNNPTMADFTTMPFFNNAQTLAEAKAAAVINKKSLLKKGVVTDDLENVLIQYDLTPTPQLEGQVKASLKPKAFEQFKAGAVKLDKGQVADLVDSTLTKTLDTLSSGKIRAEDVGILADQDTMLKALTTFNAPLTKTLFQSFQSDLTDSFGKVPAELTDTVKAMKDQRWREQELGQMYRSLSQQRVALKSALQENNATLAKKLSDDISVSYKVINQTSREVRKIKNGLLGTPETDLKRATDIVNDMWIPMRSQVEGVSAQKVDLTKRASGDVERSQNFIKRFLPYENPLYIKADSDLAAYSHSLYVTNQDIGKYAKKNIFNVERQVAKDLGTNNPVSEVLFEGFRQRKVGLENAKKTYLQQINDLGIKEGSQESRFLELIGEKRLEPTSAEFLKLPPASQQKVLEASGKMRGMYDELLDQINSTMRKNQLPEINKRDDYFHHFQQIQNDLPNMIDKYLSGQGDEVAKNGVFLFGQREFDPKMTTFGASKKRMGDEGPGDAIQGMKYYLNGALERIFMTDLIRQVDSAKFMAPTNLANLLQDFKNNHILRIVPDKNDLPPWLRKGFETVRKNQARGALLGKVTTALQQLASIPLNSGMSGKHALKSLMTIGSDANRALVAQSKNLAMRDIVTEGSAFAPGVFQKYFNNVAGGKLKRGMDIWEGFLEKALKGFDRVAVEHGFLTGYHKAVDMGLDHAQALRFGDHWANTIQADMTSIGRPEFYQTVIGRSLGQFQSFTINLFASVMNDLPRYAESDGAAKAMSLLLKTAAGVSLSNEVMRETGIPGAFDLKNLVPFTGAARFGVPGLIGAGAAGLKYMASDDERDKKEAKRKLQGFAVTATGIPGAGQAFATGKYLLGKKNKKDPLDIARGILFGPSSAYTQEEQDDKVRKERKGFVRKKVKKFIGE